MKSSTPKKQTRAEEAYVRDMARRSAFEKVDSGETRILGVDEVPEPLKRLSRPAGAENAEDQRDAAILRRRLTHMRRRAESPLLYAKARQRLGLE
jgi:hypothetical protein